MYVRLSRGAEGTNVDGARDWSAATAWSESNRSRREGVIPLLVDALLRPNGGTNGEGCMAGSAPTENVTVLSVESPLTRQQ
jgi:hypothetical protein